MSRKGRGGKREGAGRPKKIVELFQANTVLGSFPRLSSLNDAAISLWEETLRDPNVPRKERLEASKLVSARTMPVELFIALLKDKQESKDDAPQFFPVEGDPGDENI